MQKKRRKLNKTFERNIVSSRKNIELIMAKIFDIDDEEIQKEYMTAFSFVISLFESLNKDYEFLGFNEKSEDMMRTFKDAFEKFEFEHEI